MEITSEIVYIHDIESMQKFDSIFKAVYCRSAQDLYRAKFFNNPVFICKSEGKEIGYAVLELHGLKRASLWHGPIIEKVGQTDLVVKELLDSLEKFGIWHIMVYPLNDTIYKSIEKLTKEGKAVKLSEANGAVVAVKKIPNSEIELLQTYNRSLDSNLKRALKNNLKLDEVNNQMEFELVVDLILQLYKKKNIPINLDTTRKSLMNDFNYIQTTQRGQILIARQDGIIVGGLILFYTRNVSMLIHAAKDKNSKVPIMQFIVHQAILKAMKMGISFCDIGAIASSEDQKDWDGFTYFKTTFGIERVSYPPTVTLALNRKGAILFKSIGLAKKIVYRLRGK